MVRMLKRPIEWGRSGECDVSSVTFLKWDGGAVSLRSYFPIELIIRPDGTPPFSELTEKSELAPNLRDPACQRLHCISGEKIMTNSALRADVIRIYKGLGG
jgi:hypothetical protein